MVPHCTDTTENILSKFLSELNINGSLSGIPEEVSCDLFWEFIDNDGLQDDLIFFVSDEARIQVCRHVPNQRPSLDVKVDWTSTLALNLICQMNFGLRISSCAYKEGNIAGVSHLVVSESTNKKVYASPLENHVDKFYESVDSVETQKTSKYSFPEIYFSVQDYETCFDDIKMGSEDILIVELYLESRKNKISDNERGQYYEKIQQQRVLFQGAISGKVLSTAYRKNVKEFGKLKGSFIMMSGPDGIGEAQLNAIKSTNEKLDSISKMKKILFGSAKQPTPTNNYNCRLTFIRLHWIKLIEILNRNQ